MIASRRHVTVDSPAGPDEAERLIALVHECVAAAVPRRALLLQLSHLPAALARPHHRRLAREALLPLLEADRARAFSLPNGDVAVVWRGDGERPLARSLRDLAALFEGGEGLRVLCRLLDLPADAAALLEAAETSLIDDPATVDAPASLAPLEPAALAALEASLAHVDMARFVRRRPVCALGPDGFRPRWERRSIALDELLAVLAPERSVRAVPWLLRRLTRTLDRRMLALLASPGELRGARAFSLKLNVASVLGAAFLHFDAALPAVLRGQVTLELLAADILADLPSYVFARDFARARGYGLALRAVGLESLAVLPPARLGLDRAHLRWSPALLTRDLEAEGADVARLVLSRADSQQAVAWGRVQGIALFQGRAVTPRAAPRAAAAHAGAMAGTGFAA
jgi:hypothetical protein